MNADILHAIGITKNPAEIYLSALSLGTASVQQLAEKTGLKRSTAYTYIENLLKDGLLEKVPIGKRTYFRASHPHILEARAEHAALVIKKAVPELEALRASMQGRPNISVLEGEKGLRQVYKEMEIANSICFWSNLELFEKQFQDIFSALSEAIGARQIRTREIISNSPEARKSAKRYALTAGQYYSARIATVEGIHNDNAIYGNTVALFRLHESNLFVIRVEDATIAQTMKAIFEMAWKNAEIFIH